MNPLEGWTQGSHTFDGVTHGTYRKGSGPGVIVIHEIPGISRPVINFAEEIVDAGFTVVMPHLFGKPDVPVNLATIASAVRTVCVSKEFVTLHAGTTAPIANWLRSLARELHGELGGPGVGAVGMCMTGGFALGMMVDPSVAAPVLCQSSAPFAVTPALGRDLGVSPADLATIKQRAANGCPVLGTRFTHDPAVGKRFDVLTKELGENFIKVEMPGIKHATTTLHREQKAVDAIIDFLTKQLVSVGPR
jgi:dienelactone hydrolase